MVKGIWNLINRPSQTYCHRHLTILTQTNGNGRLETLYSLFVAHCNSTHVPGVAADLLNTPDDQLEFNSRRLKKLCKEELQFVAEEGRFNFQWSTRGSMLFSIVSSMADGLMGDTQLSESINSCIKLICTRCPKIDLSTLSARITTKKAIEVKSKKWSVVKKTALPLLRELESFGADSNIIHKARRFAGLVDAISWDELSHHLANEDFSIVMPSLKQTLQLKWVAASACKLRSLMNSLDSVGVLAPSVCSRVLALQDKHEHDADKWSFYHISTTLRSQTILSRLELSQGKLFFTGVKGGLEFISVAELFGMFFDKCQMQGLKVSMYFLQCQSTECGDVENGRQLLALRDCGGDVLEAKENPLDALRDSHGALQQPFACLQKICWNESNKKVITTTPRMKTNQNDAVGDLNEHVEFGETSDAQEIQEFVDLNAGYGLADTDEASTKAMEEELFDGMVARMNASTLRKAEETYARSSSNKTSLANLDTDKAIAHLTESCTNSRVGLTEDEIEEEAFLLLAKEAKIKSEREEVKSDVSRTLIDSIAQFETVTSSEEEIGSIDESPDDTISEHQRVSKRTKTDRSEKSGSTSMQKEQKQLARVAKLVNRWADHCANTLRAIVDASNRCQVPLGQGDELSLVARVPVPYLQKSGLVADDDDDSLNAAIELVFVKWVNPIEREGRTVRVVDSRVVYAPATMFGRPVPSHLFTGPQNEVLINCIGACSRKQKGNLRDELPELVQRFFSFAGISATYANKAIPFWWWVVAGHT